MIPFVDVSKEFELLKNEITSKINKILFSGQFILGEEVSTFEESISHLFKTNFSIAVNSGTDALHFALIANNIQKGDQVITTPLSFMATTEAILYAGAEPVFVDIDKDTFNIDVNKVEQAITEKTKAILPVHLYGNPCNLDKLTEICNKHNLIMIEDCAQSFGTKYKDRYVGTFGDVGCFSFYPTKNLGCYGDGGLIITNKKEHFHKFLLYRNHGLVDGEHKIIGFNSRLDSIQAGILNVKLSYLNQFIEKRRKLVHLYKNYLSDIEEISMQKEEDGAFHSYNLITFVAKKRDELFSYLKDKGISCGIYYKKSIPEQPSLSFLSIPKDSYFIASNIAKQVISLPLYPTLSESSVKDISQKIKEFYAS